MPSAVRAFDRATYDARRQLADIGGEFRERRLTLSTTQQHTAEACRISRSRYCRIEAGRVPTLTLLELNRISSVLGLDAFVRLYPGGPPVRDAAQSGRLSVLLAAVQSPLK